MSLMCGAIMRLALFVNWARIVASTTGRQEVGQLDQPTGGGVPNAMYDANEDVGDLEEDSNALGALSGEQPLSSSHLMRKEQTRTNIQELLNTSEEAEVVDVSLISRLAQRTHHSAADEEPPASTKAYKSAGRDCQNLKDGKYPISTNEVDLPSVVECKGGWAIFQKRVSNSNFEQPWAAYQKGFGDAENTWLGLDALARFTADAGQLKVTLVDADGVSRSCEYSKFRVGPSEETYKLTVSGHAGDLKDSLIYHSGQKFTTKDEDNDVWVKNCAKQYKGGWWYKNCHQSNLNGNYFLPGKQSSYADGICWYSWHGHRYSMKESYMAFKASASRRRDSFLQCNNGYNKNGGDCEATTTTTTATTTKKKTKSGAAFLSFPLLPLCAALPYVFS